MSDAHSEITRRDCLRSIGTESSKLATLARGNIAITGGTGFLGTWLVETIAALNDEFDLEARLQLYSRNPRDWAETVPHLASRKDIEYQSVDIRAPFQFAPGTTHIIHAAGIPDNRVHSSDPLRVFHTSVVGTLNTLEAASKQNKLEKFLFIGSGLLSSVPSAGRGGLEDHFLPFDPNTPHAVYLEGKRAAENLSAIYRSQFRIPVTVIRPFTLVGPYQLPDRPWAINNFIRDALAGGTIRLQGDGSPRRSFLYGSDAAFWTLCALASGAVARAYNLGGGAPVSLKEAAECVARVVGKHIKISYGTLSKEQMRPQDFYPDLSRIRTELGVKESFTLQEAIEATIAWQKSVER